MWDASESGKHLHNYRQSVASKVPQFSSVKNQKLMSQLRTGYVKLNYYQNKMGLHESPLCQTCCCPETVTHFIEECEQYQDFKEKLRIKLFQETGINEFTARHFLEIKDVDSHKNERQAITNILEEFISGSGRLSVWGKIAEPGARA